MNLLRPPADRGPVIAAGAVLLTVGVILEELRLADEVATGVHLTILAVASALLLVLGLPARAQDGPPPAFQSVLLVCGLGLLYVALLTLSDVLGADFDDDFPAGAFVWTSLLQAGAAAWPAARRRSAICAWIAAVAVGIAFLSAIDWIFGVSSATTYRWFLLVLAVAFAVASVPLRDHAPRHAEQLVNAAGLAILTIVLIAVAGEFFVDSFAGDGAETLLPNGWEGVVLVAGCALIAYGALDRAPGAAWLGVANLAGFVASAGLSDAGDETLRWWPLLLLAAGTLTIAAGLRRGGPLLPAGRPAGDDDETVVRVRDDS